jgi:hypothetical protein
LADAGGVQAASGKAEEESIAELLATTTQCWLYLGPVVAWAPIRAAEDLPDTAWAR